MRTRLNVLLFGIDKMCNEVNIVNMVGTQALECVYQTRIKQQKKHKFTHSLNAKTKHYFSKNNDKINIIY